jgi:disulfide bond formation protein DsbB
MIGEAIGFFLRNLPAFLFVAALVFATLLRGRGDPAERLLAWILLLPIGVTGLWAGISHVFFPAVAAAHIGWQTSPFQFEVGMADLAVGVTACIAFWQDLSFKAASVCAASVFLLGDAIGHVREMMVAGNFAPGNAGLPFYMDIICPVLAIIMVIVARRREERGLPVASSSNKPDGFGSA